MQKKDIKLIKLERTIYELCNKLRNLEIKGKKYTSNWHQNMELLTEAIEIETKYRKQIDLTNILTTDATIIRNPFNHNIREYIESTIEIDEIQKRIEELLLYSGYEYIISKLKSNFINKEEELREIEFERIKQEITNSLKEYYQNLDILVIDAEEAEKDLSSLTEKINEAILTGANVETESNEIEKNKGMVIEVFNKKEHLAYATKRAKKLEERIINYYLQGDIKGLIAQEIDALANEFSYNEYIRERLIYKKYNELFYLNYITNYYMIERQNESFKNELYGIFGQQIVDKTIYKAYKQDIEKELTIYLDRLSNSFQTLALREEDKLFDILLNVAKNKAYLLLIKENKQLMEELITTIENYIDTHRSNVYLSTFYEHMNKMCEEVKDKMKIKKRV